MISGLVMPDQDRTTPKTMPMMAAAMRVLMRSAPP